MAKITNGRRALSPARSRRGWLLATVMLSLLCGLPREAAAQANFTEETGNLPDGTFYRIRVPSNWNKTLVRDLDFAGAADNDRNRYLLQKGFALSGTQRHPLRRYQYDPAREIANLNLVHDRFEARFGRPDRVIQFGCSGGGNVALEVAEDFPERVDGVVATAAHTPVWLMNTFLDGWFVLKALIAPELIIVNLPNDVEYGFSGHGMEGPIPAAWREAIDRAQKTPEGRARIALAFTIGQWPAWVNELTPQPSLDDVHALQHSMYHTAYQNARSPGGEARIMKENAANGQQLSWNTGIDYKQLFENGNESFQRAVRQLYQEAGLDLQADLDRINAFPRVEASPHALQFWSGRGRTVRGNPKIPVFRMHEIGDYQVPVSLVQGYEEMVKAKDAGDLLRTAYVNAPGHCAFNAAETAAAFETLMRRLDTGKWDSTTPEELNKRAAALEATSKARFAAIDRFKQAKYNRVWYPE